MNKRIIFFAIFPAKILFFRVKPIDFWHISIYDS